MTYRMYCVLCMVSLQQSLTELQQQQLDQLHNWLQIIEEHVQLLDSSSRVPGNIQEQIEKHRVCSCLVTDLFCHPLHCICTYVHINIYILKYDCWPQSLVKLQIRLWRYWLNWVHGSVISLVS